MTILQFRAASNIESLAEGGISVRSASFTIDTTGLGDLQFWGAAEGLGGTNPSLTFAINFIPTGQPNIQRTRIANIAITNDDPTSLGAMIPFSPAVGQLVSGTVEIVATISSDAADGFANNVVAEVQYNGEANTVTNAVWTP